MTRYTSQTPIHLAGPTPSTDADGDTMTIAHVGLTSTPPLIDWATVTVVALSIPGKGTLEIAQSGLPVYDDLGDPSNHPGPAGHSIVRVYYRVIDSKGAIAPNVGWCDIDLTTLAAETTPPTLASMAPAIDATNVDPAVAPRLRFSEKIQQGASGKVLTARDVNAGTTIKTWTIPGDIGSGPGKVQFVDTDVLPRFASALPNGVKVSFQWDAGFVKDLPGNPVAAQTDDSVCFTTVVAQPITVIVEPYLNIANLVPGARIDAAWVAGSYSATTGTCTEGTPVYHVNGQVVAASYTLSIGDTVNPADVHVTAPSGLFTDRTANPNPFPNFTVGQADFRGYQPGTNYGTAGDFFVAPNGSDSNPGTLAQPYATIDYAAKTNPGKTIRVRGGVYPPARLAPSASGTAGTRTRIMRYGAEDPVIRGSSVLAGLTRCTSADAADVGPLWANVFAATVNIASIASADMDAACPVENGQPLALAGDFGGNNARWPVEVQCVYDNADHTYNLNAGKIESFNYPELGSFPLSQVLAARVYYTKDPNVGAQSAVESYSGGVLTLANKSAVPATTIYKNRVSVRNIPAAIQRGQWAYIVQPGGLTAKLYIWPFDEASVGANIRVATSTYLLDLNGVKFLDIKGIRLDHCASASTVDIDNETGIADTTLQGSDVTIEGFQLSNVFRPRVRHNGGIYCVKTHRLTLDQFEVRNIYGCFGLMVNSGTLSSISDLTTQVLIRRGRFENTGYSAIRIFSNRQCAIVHCELAASCGVCPHANKLNFYSTCHECIWLQVQSLGALGYGTWQDSTAIDCVGGDFLGNPSTDDIRAMFDQNGRTGTTAIEKWPGLGLDGSSKWFNFRLIGDPQMPGTTTGTVGLGSNPLMPMQCDNYLVDDATGFWANATRGKGVVNNGSAAAQEVSESRSATFENFAAGDIRIKPGSVVRSMRGNNKTADIAFLKARYPHVPAGDWDLDINGNPINWADPPIGSAVDYAMKVTGATFFTAATPAVPAIVGQPATWTPGYHQPFWQVPTYTHYRKLPSDLTWAKIPGATGAAYTPVSGDLGYQLAREAYLNGAKSFCINTTPVAASYVLSDPTPAFSRYTVRQTGTQFEIPAFDVQNRPLLIAVLARMSGTVKTTATVTIGAPGRAYGTGTVISGAPTQQDASRAQAFASMHFIAAPGAALGQTIQITFADPVVAFDIEGNYFDGATSIEAVTSQGVTGTTWTYTRATAVANAMMFYFGVRAGGGTGLAITNANQLSSGATGTGGSDFEFVTGFEPAPTPTTYDAIITAAASGSIITGSVVVKST